eukprot:CAMPEP_0181170420 /NCGR_PEP_ID=MMETSP1096-20121128/1354_1 /TAXON_ID=156174 ORGANISM="Chrysochromulina ericina, Strain CCMP281" /NCGR_SAMPLE_ID=MMETSP1096 /ASSEMBLY_ACC=CAM_ASM_000453 /LENGTH=159 /DNA_ID=CAMNT_0023257975 /DNA_START=215 /DNA_END=692 /DNA_ORIENTATION=+
MPRNERKAIPLRRNRRANPCCIPLLVIVIAQALRRREELRIRLAAGAAAAAAAALLCEERGRPWHIGREVDIAGCLGRLIADVDTAGWRDRCAVEVETAGCRIRPVASRLTVRARSPSSSVALSRARETRLARQLSALARISSGLRGGAAPDNARALVP